MEASKILVEVIDMQEYSIKFKDDKIEIGRSPKLVIDLKDQNHMIFYQDQRIPYRVNIQLSPDLIRGQRSNVLRSTLKYHYQQACQFLKDSETARTYQMQRMRAYYNALIKIKQNTDKDDKD